eukprot:520119-Prorocentrum_minimum.AAC.2
MQGQEELLRTASMVSLRRTGSENLLVLRTPRESLSTMAAAELMAELSEEEADPADVAVETREM